VKSRPDIADVPAHVANAFLTGDVEPFVIEREIVAALPSELLFMEEPDDVLVTPLRWDPDGFGGIVTVRASGEHAFTDHDLRIARGVADIASLALGTARRLSELERFHELVESLDAIFWEANASDLRLELTGPGSADGVTAPKELVIAADGTSLLEVSVPKAAEAGTRRLTLEYTIRNVLIAPGEGLPFSIVVEVEVGKLPAAP
jgi:hypothetical protein